MDAISATRRIARCVIPLLGIYAFSISPAAAASAEDDYTAAMVAYQRADFTTGIPLLRKAADAGHVKAQVVLASVLDAADSDEEAIKYYRMAAATGNLDGLFGLGAMIAAGEGTKKDPLEARKLITRAAEGGQKEAIGALAMAYINGELGIPEVQRKDADALKWIRAAADNGLVAAIEALEKAYREGGYGLRADVVKADELKKKLASIKGLSERKGRRKGEKP